MHNCGFTKENNWFRYRAAAIIVENNCVLFAGNETADYYYSIGGAVHIGEKAEDAVIREVFEETGVKMEIERLDFVHENYFYGDAPSNFGKMIYEISFFFYMKVPSDFSPVCDSFTEDDTKEYLKWITLSDDEKIYPEFFKTELEKSNISVKHFISDGR